MADLAPAEEVEAVVEEGESMAEVGTEDPSSSVTTTPTPTPANEPESTSQQLDSRIPAEPTPEEVEDLYAGTDAPELLQSVAQSSVAAAPTTAAATEQSMVPSEVTAPISTASTATSEMAAPAPYAAAVPPSVTLAPGPIMPAAATVATPAAAPAWSNFPATPQAPVATTPTPPARKDEFKIFLGGLSWSTTDESLNAYLSQFGTCIDTQVLREPETGKSRGFGFACFASAADIDNVMAQPEHFLDGKAIDPKRTVHKRVPHNRSEKLFIGGVPLGANNDNLRECFAEFGPILDVNVLMDRATGRPKGYAFVTFEDQRSAEAALAKYDAQGFLLYLDKRVDVKRANQRERTAAGQLAGPSGRGDGYGGGYPPTTAGYAGAGTPYDPRYGQSPYSAAPNPYTGTAAAGGYGTTAPSGYDMAAYNSYMTAAYYAQYYGAMAPGAGAPGGYGAPHPAGAGGAGGPPPPGYGAPPPAAPGYGAPAPTGYAGYPPAYPPSQGGRSDSPLPPPGVDKSRTAQQRGYHPYAR